LLPQNISVSASLLLLHFPPPLPTREPHGYDKFNVAMPIIPDFCPLERVGSSDDGGKFLCGVETLKDRSVVVDNKE